MEQNNGSVILNKNLSSYTSISQCINDYTTITSCLQIKNISNEYLVSGVNGLMIPYLNATNVCDQNGCDLVNSKLDLYLSLFKII